MTTETKTQPTLGAKTASEMILKDVISELQSHGIYSTKIEESAYLWPEIIDHQTHAPELAEALRKALTWACPSGAVKENPEHWPVWVSEAERVLDQCAESKVRQS